MKIKLSDWCKNNGIKYLEAYRWFREGKMPAKVSQEATGTIFVEIDDFGKDYISNIIKENVSNDDDHMQIVSEIIKKTIDFNKLNKPLEDLASYIISNYKFDYLNKSQKELSVTDTDKSNQEHFKQFLNPPSSKEEVLCNIKNGVPQKELDASDLNIEEDEIPQAAINLINQKLGNDLNKIKSIINPTIKNIPNVVMRPLDEDLSVKDTTIKGMVSIRPISDESSVEIKVMKKDCVGSEPRNLKDIKAKQNREKKDPFLKAASAQEKEDEELEDMVPYLPVKYDEARAYVDVLVKNGIIRQDPYLMDKAAKSFCQMSRETFEGLKGE